MKFRFLRSILFITYASMSMYAVPAYAQINIAVVDIDAILSGSKAAKSVQKQVESKRKGFIADVKKAEEKLRADQKTIEKQRNSLSKEELLQKAQEFEKRRIEARNSIQNKKTKLDKGYAAAMNTLTKVIYEVCQDIANEDKIDLIITRQNIIVGSMSLDITKKVMERMNSKLPSLEINIK